MSLLHFHFPTQKRPPEQHFALRVAFLSFDVADVFCRRKEYGDARCALTAGVKVLEKNLVRRPVKGGPARIRRKEMAAQRHRVGGPGVHWTPGRRPPHRNGGARRLSGYAAKSRSDAPTGGALSEPIPLFPAAVQAAIAKGLGPCLISARSRKNNDVTKRWQIDGHKAKLGN